MEELQALILEAALIGVEFDWRTAGATYITQVHLTLSLPHLPEEKIDRYLSKVFDFDAVYHPTVVQAALRSKPLRLAGKGHLTQICYSGKAGSVRLSSVGGVLIEPAA